VSLQATAREAHGVIIIDLSGRITLGEGSALLREMIREHLQKGQIRIILNLSDVNYIDSSGIGELVSGFTTTKSRGGELKLLNLTRKVHDLIQITRLFTVFDIHSDEKTAASSFR
jgi:anti-sigma B factor antagonist